MSLAFDGQLAGTRSATQAVEVESTGATPLSIGGIGLVGQSTGDFVVTADDCSGDRDWLGSLAI